MPQTLRPRLRSPRQWWWTTTDIDPLQMYLFDPDFVRGVLAGETGDYAAISHAGHGANSYTLTYHLVHEHLAVIMQIGWGGVYTDNIAAADQLRRLWSSCDRMLHHQPAHADGRVLCVYSDIRSISACGWIPATVNTGVDQFLRDHRTVGENAFQVAELLLAPHDE